MLLRIQHGLQDKTINDEAEQKTRNKEVFEHEDRIMVMMMRLGLNHRLSLLLCLRCLMSLGAFYLW